MICFANSTTMVDSKYLIRQKGTDFLLTLLLVYLQGEGQQIFGVLLKQPLRLQA